MKVEETSGQSREVEQAPFDIGRTREDFPILSQRAHDRPLAYLDNAATAQKPSAVIEALRDYYSTYNSNVHRGVHSLSDKATRAYEEARVKAQRFIGAMDPAEIVFVRGTTEAINLVAQSYCRRVVQSGDEILITAMEHHSNIVPWQMICEETGASLRVAPISDTGDLVFDQFESLLNSRTKIVSVAHASHVLGTINPIKEIIQLAHSRNVPVLVDGAQAAPHLKIDVRDLDCDFYAFSGHKLYGPIGIGALYGKAHLLETMAPYQGGGDMIASVSFEKTTYNVPPYKFEAGTPNVAGAIGLGAAIDYLDSIGLEAAASYEHELLSYALESLSNVAGVHLIGAAEKRVPLISLMVENVHPHDAGTILDLEGVAVRTGHCCAEPLMHRFRVPAVIRASMAFYNTKEEIDSLVAGLHKVREIFA